MKKKLIIFLVNLKVRKFDFDRFDAQEIEKSDDIDFEFHELVDYLSPGFSEMFTAERLQNKKVKIFTSFDTWKKEVLKKADIYKDNLIIYNAIEITNFKTFKINYFLSKKKIKTIITSFDHPEYSSSTSLYKIKWLIRNILFNFKKIRLFITGYFFIYLGKILKIKPDFLLKNGSTQNKYENKTCVKILRGHSLDYNMSLKSKNKILNRKEKFGLFLESASPIHNLGDSFIVGDEKNMRGTAEKWLLSLNNFFSILERTLKIKILIAPHPKIKHKEKFSKIYNGREILDEKLSIAAKYCELIISRDSAGFSFAAFYNKPAIFVYNDELKQLKNNFINNQKNFSNELGLNPVNMDKKFSKNEIFEMLNFNKDEYLNFIKKYHSYGDNDKLNFQVIAESLES